MPYQPKVNGVPSVSRWYLQFRFLTKEQCSKFIELLLKSDMDFNFEFNFQKVNDGYVYWVKISESIHVKSLKKITKLLEKVDYEIVEED